MCVVSVNIDEAVLRDMRPDLDSTEAIRLWAQQLIDLRIQELREEEMIDLETMRENLHQMVRDVYAMQ